MDPFAALKFLVGMAGDYLMKYKQLIDGADENYRKLQVTMILLNAQLLDSANDRGKNKSFEDVYKQIRTLVYQMEDTLEMAAHDLNQANSKNALEKVYETGGSIINVAEEIQKITTKVEQVINQISQLRGVIQGGQDLDREIKLAPPGMSRNMRMIGFKTEMDKIIKRLGKETEELDVISIIGMPGLGKTTLAYKIFNHPDIKSKFDKSQRIWINVSPKYRKKDLLLSILSHWDLVTDAMRQDWNDQELSETVYDILEEKDKFLIVLDDVWGLEAWRDLEGAFPESHKAGKILITTQHDEVASGSDRIGDPHKLRQLTADESWDLLRSEAFEGGKCTDEETKSYGKAIAEKCGGLPYLLVKIGRALKSKCKQASTQERRKTWERAHADLSGILKADDFQNYRSFYDTLPYHLRQCFLYLGMFPEGFEISVRRLTRLWIAEGFVRKDGQTPPENTARDYFHELLDRNLLVASKKSIDGGTKTCYVHYMLREFCRMEASSERENVFQEMKYLAERRDFNPRTTDLNEHRRLSMTSNVNEFFKFGPSCPLVHSFMCFFEDKLNDAYISSIPEVLKRLRILEAKELTVPNLPVAWKQLALLRHVVLSSKIKAIPEFISELRNMQTFIVYTTSSELTIPANICNMSELSHLETNVPTKLLNPGKVDTQGKSNLQTLGMISSDSCSKLVFQRLWNLRKFGIHGRFNTLEKANELKHLEKLKLASDPPSAFTKVIGGNILPNSSAFPENLKRLTLCVTYLKWEQMSNPLGRLGCLEVLKLKKNAFKGDSWQAEADGFPRLRILYIEHCDLAHWTASVNPFPKLEYLTLSDCKDLVEIPQSLSKSDYFKKLCFKGVFKQSAVTCAKEIKQANEGELKVILPDGTELD